MKHTFNLIMTILFCFAFIGMTQAAFVHPGCLSTQDDLDRMATKVAASEQPWKGSWDILVGNEGFYMGGPEAVPTVCVDSGNCGNSYMNLARDSHRAYQCALRWHGSGNMAYANKAVQIMNAWASTHTAWDGNSNVFLRMGLYGYAFACAAELMRGYSGWAPADFAAFQQYMRTQFYSGNSAWLAGQNNSHYWANWTLANMCSMLAIGVLCDDQAIFDEALNHFYNGVHTGGIEHSVYYVHPNGLGQWQESGRDQGHAQIGPQLIGVFCEIAWNQGYDLYGYLNNRVLAGVEYISKYNTGHAVPFAAYVNSDYAIWPNVYRFVQKDVAGPGGVSRPGWDLIYNHYVNRMGITAPYTAKYAEVMRPEGGGSNYGGTSGGFDGLGFTTLTHSRDPIASGAVPGTLRPYVQGRQITLSWAGSAYAQSYNVKRSATSGGPYTTLGTVDGKDLFYIDPGLTAGTTYYYVVSANNPGGESANSAEAAATADGQLFGTVIGSDYSYDHCGATREILFDGSLENFIDIGQSGGGWAGLDLGSGVSAVITGVKYCPRKGFANAMVGGKFQASNTADFSGGVIDLYTITTAPSEGVLTSRTVNSGSAYRYVRYIQSANNGWNTAAEVQFLGTASGQSVPSVPVVEATLVNGLQIVLSLSGLSGVPGVGGYRIKRSTTPGGPYVIWGDVNTGYGDTTKFSDVETEVNATYYYVVSAYNQIGESANSAEVSISTLPTGPQLMTHLKMSGNVADSSGYNFQAGTVGSPEYSGEGYVGSAIDLDGVDDFVTLHSHVVDSDDITVAAWVNWDGGAAWQRIFDFGNNTSQYIFLSPLSGGNTLRFAIKNGGAEQIVETTQLSTGVWVHVAVTLGGNTARLYVNGVLRATNAGVTINPSDFKPRVNYIGKSQWADPLFNGRVDEFRVYNYALSAGEVAALAAQAPETTPPAAPTELSATAGDGTVNLNWADNGESDFASYTVYRSTTSGSGYSMIASGLTASAYIDNTVSNGLTYYYVVTAIDTSGGESADSSESSATPRGMPIAHYKLEGNTLDGSGNGNNATTTGSPAYVEGRNGQAIDLDGLDDYITIPSGVVGAVENITVAAWVNWDGGGSWQRIFDFGDSTSRYMFLTPSSGGSGTLRFAINNGKGEQITETSVLTTGTWVHVAVTLSGNTATLYVGGFPVAINVASINPTGFDFKPAKNYIGKSQFGSDPLFNGRIDDFRIYNYALSETQVAALAANTEPPSFTVKPINNLLAIEGTAYAGNSLAAYADDPDGMETVTFSKDDGPAWLKVALDGTLFGTPHDSDVGENTFTVRVTDDGGLYDTAAMTIQVANTFSGTQGLDDLLGLASQWLAIDCLDTPACRGADLDSDFDVTVTDLAVLAHNWLGNEDLQLHLKFDETSGNTAYDSSLYWRAGTLVNNPVWSAGYSGGALNYDGVDDYVQVTGYKGVTGTASRTCTAWIKTTTPSSQIISWGATLTGEKWMFRVNEDGTLRAEVHGGYIYGTTPVADGNWHHVAVVLTDDGSPNINEAVLYIDGLPETTLGGVAACPVNTAAAADVKVGVNTPGTVFFKGLMDEVRIYDTVLTQQEVQQIAGL
ncbi:MAG: alginate lyase family protein [Phycisphaerae bacterium]|nr:alginate lyase family protein [Phycisphaerae bacterium]